MVTVKSVYDYIDSFAGFDKQCSWDNSGLLVGDPKQEVFKVGICLDLTAETLEEGKKAGVDLIITHHPLIFTAQKNFLAGDKAFELARNGISLICAHTSFDCADSGVNDALCELLEIEDFVGIETEATVIPMARIGFVKPQPSTDFARFVAKKLNTVCRVVDCKNEVKKVAVCGGAGAEFALDALKSGADAYVTSELKHHEMLLFKEKGITVIDAGHFETENPSMAVMKRKLENQFEGVQFVILKQAAPAEYISY